MFFQSLLRRRGIGANSYLLELGDSRIILDSGMDPRSDGEEALPQIDALDYNSVDAFFITHSHLDHLGSAPVTARHHPRADIYMTEATHTLADAMLHNSVNVMVAKREELDLKELPFYTHREATTFLKRALPCHNNRKIRLGSEIEAELYDAGHVLGACGVKFTYKNKTIFYTGDVHFEDQTLLKGADFPTEGIDTLIIETTRGGKERDPSYTREAEESRLAEHIRSCYERGGSVLIPVFALGKTQEALVMLDQLKHAGEIPEMPIYIGGLSTKVTSCFDKLVNRVRRKRPGLKILEQIDHSVLSRGRGGPIYNPGCIYLLSSGMMTEHTVSNGFAPLILNNPRNTILFIGYADPASPAGKMQAAGIGGSFELIEGKQPVDIKCPIEVFDFSGHAPRDQLLDYILKVNPSRVLLVHGDDDAMEWFQKELAEKLPHAQVIAPEPGVPINLG